MLSRIVSLSIRFRGAIAVLAAAMLVYGIYVTKNAKFDVYPEFAPPQVVVQTEAPGLSPEQTEQLVTRPLESALNGTPALTSIRSTSVQGLSVITLFFSHETSVYHARQLVAERLAEAAANLPQGVGSPGMAPLTGAANVVLAIGLTSASRSLMELRSFADWNLRPRLLAVPGVARVSIFGGEERQLQIQVQPQRLAAFQLGMNEVIAAGRRATGVRGAGFVESPAQRIAIQTSGQALQPQELGEAIVGAWGGTPVRLKDVSKVVEGFEPKIGDATINGRRGVLIVISSQFGANTLEVTDAVERALEEMKPAISAQRITLHPALFRPADFIRTAVRNVNRSLFVGGILVCAVLFLFLFNLRTALISITAIPLSLLAAVIALDRMGISLNTLTLGGLAIAIGEVVDDAIIDVENIFRRLRENAAAGFPRSRFQVVLDASLEVRGAVVYATFVVALVFLPVLGMTGVEGRLFAPLGLAYVLAVIASLGVALTLTPALAFFLLARGGEEYGETRFLRALRSAYVRLLRFLTGHRAAVALFTAAVCLGAGALLTQFGGEFLPEFREGHLIVHAALAPGTSIEESVRVGSRIAGDLLKLPFVASVAQQAGRAERFEDTWGPEYSEIHVKFKPLSGREAALAEEQLRRVLSGFPGIHFAVYPYLAERIDEVISGVMAEVVVKIFDDDLARLDQTSRRVLSLVKSVPGAADVQLESPPEAPLLRVDLRPERLAQLGFQPVEVLEAIQTAYQGAVVAQTFDGNRAFPVAVILDPDLRRDPELVGSLLVSNAGGVRAPLHALADVSLGSGRYSILHEAARRRQAVTANVRGRDVQSFVAELRRRLDREVKLPPDCTIQVGGAEEAFARAHSNLLVHSSIVGVAILVLLSIVFRNLRNLLLVLANLPFAFAGGVAAAYFAGARVSVGTMVGFVTLFGITMRNSMMLITHFDHLVRHEGVTWGPGGMLRGASERLAPVLMTAAVTALGLLPMALGSGEPGREIEGPMAIVILGGLATSTVLNLTVLPAWALRFGRFGSPAEN
jgi:CzcA family heavy metal efflux pump